MNQIVRIPDFRDLADVAWPFADGELARYDAESGKLAGYTLDGAEIGTLLGFTPQSAADVSAAIAAVVDSSPAALDTLNELAAALGDDANFAATVNAQIAAKVGGSGTIGALARFTAASAIGDSRVSDDSTNILATCPLGAFRAGDTSGGNDGQGYALSIDDLSRMVILGKNLGGSGDIKLYIQNNAGLYLQANNKAISLGDPLGYGNGKYLEVDSNNGTVTATGFDYQGSKFRGLRSDTGPMLCGTVDATTGWGVRSSSDNLEGWVTGAKAFTLNTGSMSVAGNYFILGGITPDAKIWFETLASGVLTLYNGDLTAGAALNVAALTAAVGANVTPLTISGYSLTGANAQSAISITGTWNTSGNPVALKVAITNTASGSTAKFVSFLAGAAGATEQFSVGKDGLVTSTKSGAHAFTVIASGQNPVGIGRNGTVGGLNFYGGQSSPSDTNADANLGTGVFLLGSGVKFGWSASNVTQPIDTAFFRNAAAIAELTNGTAGRWGGLKLGFYGAATNTVSNGLTIGTRSSGTPAPGLGAGLLFTIDATAGNANQDAAQIAASWSVATYSSRTAIWSVYLVHNAAALAEALRVDRSTAADDTGLWLYDANSNSMKRVVVGAADSGGTGYRLLRIAN